MKTLYGVEKEGKFIISPLFQRRKSPMNKKILVLGSLLLFFLLIPCTASARRGISRQLATPSNILMVNSWYQKDKIHVYLANTGKVPLSLTIGIGTYLSGDRVFESKEVRIDAKTVKTIELPVITKEFKRGKRVSDTVFVYQDTEKGKERISMAYVQGLHPASLGYSAEKYLIMNGEMAGFEFFAIQARRGNSIVLVAMKGTIVPSQKNRGTIRFIKTSTGLKPIETKDIKDLDAPEEYKTRIAEELNSYYGFLVGPIESQTLFFEFFAPPVAKCALLTVRIRRYDFLSSNEVSYGGKQGPMIMICNPESMAGL